MDNYENIINNIEKKTQELRYAKEGDAVLVEDFNKKYEILLDLKDFFDRLVNNNILKSQDVINFNSYISQLSEKEYGDYVSSKDWSNLSKAVVESYKLIDKMFVNLVSYFLRIGSVDSCHYGVLSGVFPNYDGNIYGFTPDKKIVKLIVYDKVFEELNKFNYKLYYYSQDYLYLLTASTTGYIYVIRVDIEDGEIVDWKEILSYSASSSAIPCITGFPPVLYRIVDKHAITREENNMLCLVGCNLYPYKYLAEEPNADYLRSANNVLLLTNEDFTMGFVYDLEGNFLFSYACSMTESRRIRFAIATRDGRVVCVDEYRCPESFYGSLLRVFSRDGSEIARVEENASVHGDVIIWKPKDKEYIVWTYQLHEYYDYSKFIIIDLETYEVVFTYTFGWSGFEFGVPKASANSEYLSVILVQPKGGVVRNFWVGLVDVDSDLNIASRVELRTPYSAGAPIYVNISSRRSGYMNNIGFIYGNIPSLTMVTRKGLVVLPYPTGDVSVF